MAKQKKDKDKTEWLKIDSKKKKKKKKKNEKRRKTLLF